MTTDSLAGYRDLHIGLPLDFAVSAGKFGESIFPNVERVFHDGDGWNVWGEALGDPDDPETPEPGTDGGLNDATTGHVIYRFTPDATWDDIHRVVEASKGSGLLVPMGFIPGSYDAGTLLVLTDAEDWSVLHDAQGDPVPVRTWNQPCAWCRADVMDEEAWPGLDICVDCAEAASQGDEDEPYTEQSGNWAYHVEVKGTEEQTDAFWGLVREAEKATGASLEVIDAIPIP